MTTGLITGAPTTAASLTTYAITASNPAGFARTYINITINGGPTGVKIPVLFSLQKDRGRILDLNGRTIGMQNAAFPIHGFSTRLGAGAP